MRVFGNNLRQTKASRCARATAAALAFVSLLANTFSVAPAVAQKSPAAPRAESQRLTEEQRIVHVLNRLAFGARPGDVERVRRMGVERYIEQQLNPAKIDDSLAESKLRGLPTLTLTTGELMARYPNPGALLRQMQRQGRLPEELRALYEARRGGAQQQQAQAGANMNAQQQPQPSSEAEKMVADALNAPMAQAGEQGAGRNNEGNAARREYRRALAEFMVENGLQSPQRIMAELHASRLVRAVHSERQLQEVLVDFWTNHFNVFMGKGVDRWFLTSYDRDVIRPHALGKFRDLLEATAKSPAMLFYLDNFQSVSLNNRRLSPEERDSLLGQLGPEARAQLEQRTRRQQRMGGQRRRQQQPQQAGEPVARQPQRMRRGINENYARELMELHTLGVDGGYTQKDVQEVARCFTGWTIFDPRGFANNEENGGRFVFHPLLHDDGEKTVLGHKIPAGGGIKDGLMVLDILARHPSTARFIATKLARRFVSDNPSRALVERVAAAYTKSDGDIRETLRALFSSPEFNSVEARRAKIKTPFEVAVSAIRALGGETNGSPMLHQWIARMGEPLYGYQAPTGYPDVAENWVNTGALLERMNFALALASNRIQGTRVDLARFTGESAATGRALEQERLVDRFIEVILQGEIPPRGREVLLKRLGEQAAAPTPQTTAMTPNANAEMTTATDMRAARRARRQARLADSTPVGNLELARVAALILGSPEFQRQ
ncbi:MAG TPA: DUF1800 domain-containing protein [Pyrinomonadaceae bacterium]|nr:DUF1800 domain-containing protein [Pyrinomonadaceae bacterium]